LVGLRPFWTAAVVALLVFTGARLPGGTSPALAGQPAPINVVATTTQIEDMARNVAGDRAQVVGILPLNADPHEYEPTTDDARKVAGADLILENGIGLEKFVADLAKNKRATTPLVTVTQGIARRSAMR
jgi:manganese transport system substrate-binding protein